MPRSLKCVVWDLDNTIWDGICLEGPVRVRERVAAVIRELDRRGILNSIASRGEETAAREALKEFGLEDLFLEPQINWLPKSQSIVRIAKELRLSIDSFAFVDDDRFEREQVAFMLPSVLVIDAIDAGTLPGRPEFSPPITTAESRDRRRMYEAELRRRDSGSTFASREEFLHSCAMTLTIRPALESDLPRVLELMTRTHQLNTTGMVLERDEIEPILRDPASPTGIVVAELEDRFGGYGIIGIAIHRSTPDADRLTFLALSCRVMGRGIERAIIAWWAGIARHSGVEWLEADFHDTGRNRMMRALYQMERFHPLPTTEKTGTLVLRARRSEVPGVPTWITLR